MILAALLPAIATAQQSEPGAISGRVTSRDGAPLAHATIRLDDLSRGAIAGRDGTFTVDDVTAGTHRLFVSYVGHSSFSTTVVVRAGMTESVEIVLDERSTGSMIIVSEKRTPYRPQTSSTATKTSTPLRETPATVQIITTERITEQRADRVSDMFGYMTGIVIGGGQRAQDYLLRGFAIDDRFIPYQVDGISGGVWRQHEPPAAIIDRIEYLKGPSSTLYGVTQLGGVINYITKKPKATAESSIELKHSSYASDLSPFGARSSATFSADMTGPIDSAGEFLYRVIGSHINTTGYRNGVSEASLDLLPEITWNISERTQVTGSLNVNVDKGAWDEFLPVPGRDLAKVPDIRVRINEEEDRYWDYGVGAGYIARHALDDDWVIRSVGRYTSRIDGRTLFQFNGMKGDGQTMRRSWREQFNERYYSYFDLTTEGRLVTGPLTHTLLAGVTLGNERMHFDRRNLVGDSTMDVNIYVPLRSVSRPKSAKPGFDRYWNNLIVGGYVQDQVRVIDEVQLVAGVQYTSASTDHEERRAGLVFEKFDAGFSPRVGVVLLPLPELSVYGSYSTSFSPTSAERENAEGNLDFEPETGAQIEGGIKFDLLGGRIGGSVAAYQIEFDNATNATGELNANGSTVYVQTGSSRSRGLELDLFLSPITGLYLTFGYGYTDARVVEDIDTNRLGERLPYVPYNAGSLWATYRMLGGSFPGLKIGMGATYMGDRPSEFPTATGLLLMLPAYTRIDGLISYEFPGATLGINVTNLLDERYWASGGVSRIIPGTPRTLRTSLQIRI